MKCFLFLVLSLSFSAHSEVGVVVKVKTAPQGFFEAHTKEIKGFATLEGTNVRAENITVDLRSLSSDNSLRDDVMKSKFLEVNNFPDALLTIASGKGSRGNGSLKLKGVEKEIKGTYRMKGTELEATFDIRPSDFGIKDIKYQELIVKDIIRIVATVPLKISEKK